MGYEPFIGEIVLFAGDYAPEGWRICDGSLLEINSNQALYAVLGTTFGGNGVTNFALPDLRGSIPIGSGISTEGVHYVTGNKVGAETVNCKRQRIDV